MYYNILFFIIVVTVMFVTNINTYNESDGLEVLEVIIDKSIAQDLNVSVFGGMTI